jgi:hypothetical protein
MRGTLITRLAGVLRPGPRSLAPVLAALALGVAACGSEVEKTIPPDNADAMLNLLEQVKASADAGNCQIAENGVTQLIDEVNALPAEVGPKTKDDLRRMVDSLGDLVQDPSQCKEPDTGPTGLEETTSVDTTTSTSTTTTTSTGETAPPDQPDDEGTGLEPGNSDNGPAGPNGNPNQGGSGGTGGAE